MAKDKRQFRIGQFAVEDVQIGAADRAGLDRDQQLTRSGPRFRQIGGVSGCPAWVNSWACIAGPPGRRSPGYRP
jgi:hypothetical protein